MKIWWNLKPFLVNDLFSPVNDIFLSVTCTFLLSSAYNIYFLKEKYCNALISFGSSIYIVDVCDSGYSELCENLPIVTIEKISSSAHFRAKFLINAHFDDTELGLAVSASLLTQMLDKILCTQTSFSCFLQSVYSCLKMWLNVLLIFNVFIFICSISGMHLLSITIGGSNALCSTHRVTRIWMLRKI